MPSDPKQITTVIAVYHIKTKQSKPARRAGHSVDLDSSGSLLTKECLETWNNEPEHGSFTALRQTQQKRDTPMA
jgi:hypothetical protein